jgi:mono/diheme cytochrome c family protein
MRKRIAMFVIAIVSVGAAVPGWIAIRRGFSARGNPSALETYIARAARRLSIPATDKNAKNPFSSTPEILREARSHFADHCATCHSNDGSGKTEIGQNLYPKAPDLRQAPTQKLTDGELYYIIHNGIRLTGMPAWGESGKDEDSWKLVVFIRHLPQISPQELKDMERFNPKSVADRSEEEEEQQFLNEGQKGQINEGNQPRKGDYK